MTKYIEFGFGNRWLIRTEFEKDDGSEWEVKGISGPIKPKSVYLRIWLGKIVYIWDWQEGFKKQEKKRRAVKFIFGIASEVEDDTKRIME
ncbi:DUF3977 family protein [Streptococcus gallinaceus]|uniref:DUF3977 family protein n=1 Tax=Streptococcus gallinaceus TaxID=165758 RepID=A0ABV2JKF2_9STRE|nr:DUF3977 family protein [Streptococcus gallinaceus]MCP1638314.1 hypothetical protein [Streptococcus gallinaceus]MCP1769599.1 hypothetical protein [Streptococcus gallinaceus]